MSMAMIICWNQSSFMNKYEIRSIINMLEDKVYSDEQLLSNFTSCYCEDLQISILSYAKYNSLSISLFYRGLNDSELFSYFDKLRNAFNFKLVEKDSIFFEELTAGEIELSLKDEIPSKEKTNGYLFFVLLT